MPNFLYLTLADGTRLFWGHEPQVELWRWDRLGNGRWMYSGYSVIHHKSNRQRLWGRSEIWVDGENENRILGIAKGNRTLPVVLRKFAVGWDGMEWAGSGRESRKPRSVRIRIDEVKRREGGVKFSWAWISVRAEESPSSLLKWGRNTSGDYTSRCDSSVTWIYKPILNL